MPEPEKTHDIAEKTSPDGTKTRTETTKSVESKSTTTTHSPEAEGEAKEIKPNGR